MKYISLFSGIGGLESKDTDPLILCEKEPSCIKYLDQEYKSSEIIDDIHTLTKKNYKLPKVDLITGGWPCQDISVAGEKKGFNGDHSVLFYELIKVAKKSKAELIIAENVPNILNLSNGEVFSSVLKEFESSGYPFISWRTINSREFNLPHQRRRIFIFASKSKQYAKNLFNEINIRLKKRLVNKNVYSFYHTAGTHSICYSKNFTPTLKVSGSGPAVFYDNVIRRLSPAESLKLQGFKPSKFKKIPDSHIYAMTGNAVSKPIGEFLFKCINKNMTEINTQLTQSMDLLGDNFSATKRAYPSHGVSFKGEMKEVFIREKELSTNLADMIDFNSNDFLSDVAITGLLRRAFKARKMINESLLNTMAAHVSKEKIEAEIGINNLDKLYGNEIHNEVNEVEENLFN